MEKEVRRYQNQHNGQETQLFINTFPNLWPSHFAINTSDHTTSNFPLYLATLVYLARTILVLAGEDLV